MQDAIAEPMRLAPYVLHSLHCVRLFENANCMWRSIGSVKADKLCGFNVGVIETGAFGDSKTKVL